MPTSSDSIGQLAGALAKAQVELINPPKTLTAVIDAGPGREPQTYRYAPLSTGSRSCAGPSAGMNWRSCRPRIWIRPPARWN